VFSRPDPAEQRLEALADDEEVFGRLLNAMPDAVVVTRADGTIAFLNQQADVLFGWKSVELLGQPVEHLLPERYRRRHVGHRALFMESPAVRPMGADLELLALHADGREIPVDISLSPFTLGGELAVISTVRDVTHRKALEQQRERLLENEQALSGRLQAVQTVSDAALTELNTDALLAELLSRIRTVLASDTAVVLLVDELGQNLVARGALGLEEEVEQRAHVPIGEGFAGRVALTHRPLAVENIEGADIVNPLLRARGIRSLLGVPLVVEGNVLGVLHVGSLAPRQFTSADVELLQLVGDRVALALDRARLFEAAQEAVRMRNEFLSAISHDLGNPVAAIRMQSRLMQESFANAAEAGSSEPTTRGSASGSDDLGSSVELAEGLGQIEATARSAWSLIEELLDLARLQVGRGLDLQWRSMDLVATVRDIVASQQATTAEHQLRLETEVPALVGEWDPARLERVITNLLSNAIKYSPQGGEIEIQLREELRGGERGRQAVLEIRDQGIGIPAADLPHIFERFRRASNVVGRFPGTGIGLAGAREIVEHHGGTLTVESREGAGTRVTVRLPLDEGPES